eukprot:6415461-Prymnesium_polylepis.1
MAKFRSEPVHLSSVGRAFFVFRTVVGAVSRLPRSGWVGTLAAPLARVIRCHERLPKTCQDFHPVGSPDALRLLLLLVVVLN